MQHAMFAAGADEPTAPLGLRGMNDAILMSLTLVNVLLFRQGLESVQL